MYKLLNILIYLNFKLVQIWMNCFSVPDLPERFSPPYRHISRSSPVHSGLKSLHRVQVDVPVVTANREHSSHDGCNPDSPARCGQLRHILPAMYSGIKALYRAQRWIVIKTAFGKENSCFRIICDGLVKCWRVDRKQCRQTLLQTILSGIMATCCFE